MLTSPRSDDGLQQLERDLSFVNAAAQELSDPLLHPVVPINLIKDEYGIIEQKKIDEANMKLANFIETFGENMLPPRLRAHAQRSRQAKGGGTKLN